MAWGTGIVEPERSDTSSGPRLSSPVLAASQDFNEPLDLATSSNRELTNNCTSCPWATSKVRTDNSNLVGVCRSGFNEAVVGPFQFSPCQARLEVEMPLIDASRPSCTKYPQSLLRSRRLRRACASQTQAQGPTLDSAQR